MTNPRYRRTPLVPALILSIALILALWPPVSVGGDLSPVTEGARRDLVLPDLDGQPVTLDAYRGKVVLINFWASWCTPCVQEMPAIVGLHAAMQDAPFQVIAINVGETARRARTAATRLGLEFPVLLDRDSEVFRRWGAEVLPTSYIVDAHGVARFVAFGPLDWDSPDIIASVRSLLTTAPSTQPVQGPSPGR